MNAPAIDVRDMLLAESTLDLTYATNLFVGKEPTKPADCVTIYDTFGIPMQLNLETQGYEYPSIQIRVRNTSYENGWAIAEEIKNLLHGRAQQTWNGTLYSVIYCYSGPTFLDWDDSGRVHFVINFNLQRRT
jgi:hypothetical protein